MTKKEIIAALKKANIQHNSKDPKCELLELLEAVGPETATGGFTCKQKGCHVNNRVESVNGNCSICGHPL